MSAHRESHPARLRAARPAVSFATVSASAYWFAALGVYVLFGFLWYFSAKEKLFDQSGSMPAGLAKAFDGSFLASVPGLDAALLILGLVEAVALLLFLASLAAGEFLPSRRKPVLVSALGFSVAVFAVMAFAENMIGDFESTFRLFAYATGTLVVGAAVVAATPERVRAWITSFDARGGA